MGPPHETLVPTLATTPDDANPRPAPASRRSALPLYALSLLLLATAVTGFIWHDLRQTYRDTLAFWDVRMSNSADERARIATLWLKERRTDTEGVGSDPLTARLLSNEANRGNLAETRRGVERVIARMALMNGFLGGAVGDTECRIVAQTGLPEEAVVGVQRACREAQRAGDFRVVASGMPQAHVWIDLAFPVFAVAGTTPLGQASRRALGAVVMTAAPWENVFFPFISPQAEPTRTTETLIVWEDEGEAVCFSPRPSMKGETPVLRRPLGGPAFESRAAREGNVRFGEFIDYRGVRVFGAARSIGPGQGSLARKVDRYEALAQFRQREGLDWLAGALSVLLFGSVIVAQRRHLAMRDLKEKLEQQQALLDLKRHVEVSEQRLRELMESVEAIVWEADARTLCPTFVSQGAERILGFSPRQWLETPNFWADHLHPEDRERGLACEQETLRKGKALSVEYRMERADGQLRWFRDFMHLVKGPEGGGKLLRGIMVDVTESKEAELALNASEERYRAFIAHSSEGIWRYEGDQPVSTALPVEEQIEHLLRFAYLAECNDALARMNGFERAAEMIGRRLKDRVADDPHNIDHLRAFIRSGYRLENAETSGKDRQGKVRHFVNNYVGVVENDYLVRAWGVQRDVTERKKAEEALRQSEEKYRSIVMNIPDIVWIIDSQGRIVFVNPNVDKFTNVTAEELYRGGLDFFFTTVHPDDVQPMKELLQAAFVDRRPHETEYRARQADRIWRIRTVGAFEKDGGLYLQGLMTDITERKRAEEGLAKLAAIVESSNDAIVGITPDGTVTSWNPGAEILFGYRPEEMIGKPISILTPAELRDETRRSIETIRQGERISSFETVRVAKGGQALHVSISVAPIKNALGEVVGGAGIARDVTERHNFVSQLRLQTAALHAAHNGIVITDRDGKIIWANPGFSALTGYQREEVIGENPRILKSGKQSPAFYHDLWDTILKGNVWHGEVTNRRKDGSFYEEEMTIAPVRDEAGAITHFIAIKQDITQRKETEEALRESEQFNREVIASAQEGVIVYDREFRYLVWNRFMEELTGMLAAQVLGKNAFDLFPHLREQNVEPLLRRALAGETAQSHDTPYLVPETAKSGWVSGTYGPHYGANGQIVGVVGIVREITERKRAEEELADRLRFETLLAELSARFVNVPGEEVDSEIEAAQCRVCEYLGLDSSTLWQVPAEDARLLVLTHVYGFQDGPPIPERMDAREHFPWCYGQLMERGRSVIAVSSLEGLPAEMAKDRESWFHFGTKSALIILLRGEGGLPIGVLSFNTRRQERTWSEEVVNRLQLVAQIFSNALARLRSDRALRESEERYRTLFEDAPVGIYRTTPEGRILAGNPTLVRMLGYSSFEELAARSLNASDFEPEYSREKFKEQLEKEGQITGLESQWWRCDGSVVFVRENARAIRDDSGRLLYYEGTSEDVTERKRAEEALRESEERFRGLSNASLEGMMIHDQGLVLDANPAFARLFGYEQPEELIGKNGLYFIIAPESRGSLRERMEQQQTGPLELTCVRKDGTRFAAETDSRPVKYLGRDASIVSCRDITERKQAQEELQLSLKQLRALAARLQNIREEERKSVAREIHDQLGQALTAIKLDLSSLARELPAELNHLAKKSTSILHLVDGAIHTVRRISAELRPGMLDDFGLVATIEWAAEVFESRSGTKCRLDLPREEITIDPAVATAVFRIFQETLTNVARHANAREVKVRLAKVNSDLMLEVHDNGKGIDEACLASGQSLGILGMRERALLFGGELKISGAPGEGTTVRVWIPAGCRTD